MSKVFDRDDPALMSTYDEALKSWESSGDDEKLSLAINLRCDHRVTALREQHFRDYFLKHNDLKMALDDYVRDRVKLASLPHFCEPWCNNLVADCVSGNRCEYFDGGIELASVISLNGLSRPIKDTYPNLIEEVPEWREIIDGQTQASHKPRVDGEDSFDAWLDSNLKDKTPEQTMAFLSKVFKVLNYRLTKEHQHYNPAWVTTWKDFAEYANLGADRWNQVVGVPRDTPTWQIVIKYPDSKVKRLYRPSQLDAGYHPQHFPSPREAIMARGGLVMDLDVSGRKLLNEYIHEQIALDIQYWIDGGMLVGKTSITPAELPRARQNHYDKLIRDYDEDTIRGWMSRPI